MNTSVTRPDDDSYDARRALARHVGFALASDTTFVEVTAEWAHPADACRPPLDEAVDGAIYRTTAMVVFTDDGGIGTGDTLRLAGDLLIPTLVLRSIPDQAPEPLQARRQGRHATRVERFYANRDDVLAHVTAFLAKYEVQIERRQAQLVAWAGRADEIKWINDAISALDPAIFETASITQAAAIFLSSDPVYWFQARTPAREELQRLVSHERPRAEQRPISAATLGATSPLEGEGSSAAAEKAVRIERASTESLLRAAEIHAWTYAVVSRLITERERRYARQTQTTSHMIPPMQERDWERLHVELFET